MSVIINFFFNILNGVIHSKIKLFISLFVLLIVCYLGYNHFKSSSKNIDYQTQKVSKGTLVVSVSASGQVSSGNSINITTQATGVVNKVYIKDGEKVTTGEKIADITLDQSSQQKQVQAWASYLQAKNQLSSAISDLNTLQNSEFSANQKFINDAVARGLSTTDPTYIQEDAAWKAAEQNYLNQKNVIAQAQSSEESALLSYNQISSSIISPTSGIINNLLISPGYSIENNSSNATGSNSTIGSVLLSGPLQATVNLTEVDIVNVHPGQKVSMTLDAFPGETFAGKVSSIDTTGQVSSGVTTYPVTINFDSKVNNIYPNMAVNANIITTVKNNVILVPSSAITTQGQQSYIRVLKKGNINSVPVTTGSASDTQTEITSGLNVGDTIITSFPITTSNNQTSPFNRTLGGFGGRGGAVIRGGARGG